MTDKDILNKIAEATNKYYRENLSLKDNIIFIEGYTNALIDLKEDEKI